MVNGEDFTLRKFTERKWTKICTISAIWTLTWSIKITSITILSFLKTDRINYSFVMMINNQSIYLIFLFQAYLIYTVDRFLLVNIVKHSLFTYHMFKFLIKMYCPIIMKSINKNSGLSFSNIETHNIVLR